MIAMTESEMIQHLYDEISRQNTVYMAIIGGLIAVFAVFQWVINEKRLNDVVEEKQNNLKEKIKEEQNKTIEQLVDKYKLDKMLSERENLNDFYKRYNQESYQQAFRELNNTSALLQVMATMNKENKESNKILAQLIENNVLEFKEKIYNKSPYYSSHLQILLENVRNLEKTNSNNAGNLAVIKGVIIFYMDPEKVEENIKDEPNIKMDKKTPKAES